MVQFADIAQSSTPYARQTWERVFVWTLAGALFARLALLFGLGSPLLKLFSDSWLFSRLADLFGEGGLFYDLALVFGQEGFLEKMTGGELLLLVMSWILLGVTFLSAMMMFWSFDRLGDLRSHRVHPHVRAWAIAALIVFAFWDSGTQIWSAIGENYAHIADLWARFTNALGNTWNAFLTSLGYEGRPPVPFEASTPSAPAKLWNILLDFFARHGLFLTAAAATVGMVLAVIGSVSQPSDRPGLIQRVFVSNVVAKIAAFPMAIVAVGVFVGATLWTVYHSFTGSKLLPNSTLIGFDQYERLWASNNNRWWQAIENLGIYAVVIMTLALTIGFLLAVLLDQKIRFENTFRTILLYPFALSFIVTGLIWQWLLNPDLGFQSVVRSLGWESFTFDPLFNPDIVIFGICIAGLWHGTGLIMCLMLAGLRGIDEEIWKAARIDGIPTWKTYLYIVIPMMRPVFITTIVLIASGILRVYDLVVAQTSGGPGIASDVPARYVYEYMFTAQNLGQGFAASTMMLLAVVVIVIPWAILEFGNRKHG